MATKKTTSKKTTKKPVATGGKASGRAGGRSTGAQVRKKAAAKKAPAKKAAAKKTTAKKTTAKKTPAKKAVVKKTVAKKSTAKKTTAKKAVAKKTTAKATTSKTAAPKAASKKTTVKRPLITRPPEPKRPPARPIKLDKATVARVRAQLDQEKKDLETRLTELEADSFLSSQSDMTGEAGLNEEFADAGTATFDRERDLSIRNNVLDLIDQVTRALHRLDEGLYGTCESCGRPIDAARLKAFPRALLCLDCKRREERTR